MYKKCMVPMCINNTTRTPNKLFIRVPVNIIQRQRWLESVNRNVKEYLPTTSLFCCEDHFDLPNDIENWIEYSLTKCRIQMKRDAVPKMGMKLETFKFVDTSVTATLSTSNSNAIQRQIDPDPLFILPNMEKSVQVELGLFDKICQKTTTCKKKDYSVNISNEQLHLAELQTLSMERTLLIIQEKSHYYIGISEKYFNLISIIAEQIEEKHHYVLLCLKKIRRNTPFSELADDFGISESYASNIFSKCVPLISECLSKFIFWPNKKAIIKNVPISFRVRYSNVQSIIDFLEIQIETEKAAKYDKCNTLKYLVSMTPYGLVNFISNGFSGTITNQHLIKESKYLDKLAVGAAVMANRHFIHVEPLILSKGCSLIIFPTSTNEKLTNNKEIIESNLRVHMKCLVTRFRQFLFLSAHSTIDDHLIKYTDSIVNIVGALINLQGPLL